MAAPHRGGHGTPADSRAAVGSGPAGVTAVPGPPPPLAPSGTALRLVVRAASGQPILATTVGAFDPVAAGGGYAPIDPPLWNQAVWVRYRPLVQPTDTAHGTSYVYGHACRHHVCAFTDLARAARGGSITVARGAQSITYRVESVSAGYPKTGPGSLAELRGGVADRSVPRRLVLVTCDYGSDDVSRNNVVVVAVQP